MLLIPVLVSFGYRSIVGSYYSIRFWGLDIMDPSLMFQHFLLNREVLLSLLILAIIPIVAALLFGKVFCSWICPFNLIAEWAAKLRNVFKSPPASKHHKNPRAWIYWSVLVSFFIIVFVTGIPMVTFFSMPGLLSVQTSDLILAGEIGIELALVPTILLIEVIFFERFWCRYACPVGATLGFFRMSKTLSVTYESNHCQFQCSVDQNFAMCNQACPLQLNPKRSDSYPYCYNCGACIEACHTHGGHALKFGFRSKSAKHHHKSV